MAYFGLLVLRIVIQVFEYFILIQDYINWKKKKKTSRVSIVARVSGEVDKRVRLIEQRW